MDQIARNGVARMLQNVWQCGAAGQRPVKILASIQTKGFGEFVAHLFYVNSVAAQFDRAEITLLYRNDVTFKRELVRFLPAKMFIEYPTHKHLPPLDLLSPRTRFPDAELKDWYAQELDRQDIVITEGMATEYGLLGFEHHGYLRVPDDSVQSCTDELIRRGLDPNRWFCTMHARESGFATAARKRARNADLGAYVAAATHIIRNLGGQVVRLGHPEMTKFPAMENLIELGLEPNSTFLQGFAVSRSRFLVCGPSGPLALGDAFHVPMAYVNAWGWDSPNDRALVRTVDVQTPDGTILSQQDVAEAVVLAPGGMYSLLEDGCKIFLNSADEMIRVINQIHGQTLDTPGWRAPDPPRQAPRPNQLAWPGNRRPRAQLISVPVRNA